MKLLWVDDDINKFTLGAYLDEFRDNSVDIIEINNPDQFLNEFKEIEHDCLIMDIMMPTGSCLTSRETNAGFETGFKLVEIYRKIFSNKRVVIFSIITNDKAKKLSKELNAEYKSKKHENPLDFYNFIMMNKSNG